MREADSVRMLQDKRGYELRYIGCTQPRCLSMTITRIAEQKRGRK